MKVMCPESFAFVTEQLQIENWVETTQSCLVYTQFPISKSLVILNTFMAEQLQIRNKTKLIETGSRQGKTVLSCRQFCSHAPPTQTRQDETVLSCPCVGRVNKLQKYPIVRPYLRKSTSKLRQCNSTYLSKDKST